MSLAMETAQLERGPDRRGPESEAKESPVQTTPNHPLAGVLTALGADGSGDGNSTLASSPVLQRSANGTIRTLVMRRMQQGVGNQRAQQFVSRLPRPSVVQRECACGGTCSSCQEKGAPEITEEEAAAVQRQASSAAGTEGAGAAGADGASIPAGSPGQPLDPGTRGFMESRFGHDFSDVRVHTDSLAAQSADAFAANAYTTGRDIYFAAGKYAPQSHEGQHLLAHELTHTVQQENGAAPMAASRIGDVQVSAAEDPLENEAEHTADSVLADGQTDHNSGGSQDPKLVSMIHPPEQGSASVLSSFVQRQESGEDQTVNDQSSATQTSAPTTDDPTVAATLNDDIQHWEESANQNDDLQLRAWARRMVLLLTWRTHPPFQTEDDLNTFSEDCLVLSRGEMETLGAFSADLAEFALAMYPEGFPLTWSGRVQAALTMGTDTAAILTDYMKALNDLMSKADSLPPAILLDGLPVPFSDLGLLDRYSLLFALSAKDSEVKDFARESLRFMQMKWIWAFAFGWELTVNQIASSVADGTIVVHYLDWKDFVDNKQAILRDLPARARALPTSQEEVQQIETDAVSLKDAALLVGLMSALTSFLGGILGGWKEASDLFDNAVGHADTSVASADDSGRLAMAFRWAWENDYFSGAAAQWADNFVKNAGAIIKETLRDLAVFIGLQFIPGVDIAVDAYLAVRLGLDVITMLDDLRSAMKRAENSQTVAQLQKASAHLAEVINDGAIQILILVATWGIGKAVSKIKIRAAELRAADETMSLEAAEKKAFEEMSPVERKPIEEAAQKVEEFDRAYSPETKPILDTPGVRSKLASINEDARSLLEFCDSPCLPPAHQLLEADLKQLERIQKQLGPGSERGLKQYFYNRRSAPGGLKQAIEDLEGIKKSELDRFLREDAVVTQRIKIKEAEKLIDEDTRKFSDEDLEKRYQDYVDRKKSAKAKEWRDRADWKVASDYWLQDSPMARGNAFNKTAGKNYFYNEVHLESGYRVDSYVPPAGKSAGEIISRKAADFDLIDQSTFENYLDELKKKYSPNDSKVRSDKWKQLGKLDIDGQTLKGKQILEVPDSNKVAANRKAFEALAAKKGIEIRYTPE